MPADTSTEFTIGWLSAGFDVVSECTALAGCRQLDVPEPKLRAGYAANRVVRLAQPFLNEDIQRAVEKAWKASRDKGRRRERASERSGSRSKGQRKMNRYLNKDEVKVLIREYESGYTQKELAAKWGIGRTTIIRLFKRHGVQTRCTERKLDTKKVAKAINLYCSGSSLADVGWNLDVSAGVIRRELLRAGVLLRSGSGPKS